MTRGQIVSVGRLAVALSSLWMVTACGEGAARSPVSPGAEVLSGELSGAEERYLEQLLRSDTDLAKVRRITKEMASRLDERGLQVEDVAVATKEGRVDDVALMLGLSVGELMEANQELRQTIGVLAQRYPRIVSDAGGIVTRARAADPLRAAVGTDAVVADELPCEGETCEDESGCRIVPYLAALTLCTAFGSTPLYFACALVALCEFCTGGLAAVVC